MSEWISVSEKLPELGHDADFPYASDMILLSDGKKVYFGSYEDSPELGADFINIDGDSYTEDGLDEITHWMPLPEPPKIKKREAVKPPAAC